jgi:RNA polymerase sigma-70 factor, ECF subfamily
MTASGEGQRLETSTQDSLYEEATAQFGGAIARLAGAYEAHPDRRRDLRQEIDIALWRSLARFDGRCSMRTWVYRVAHNVAATHVLKEKRIRARGLVSLDALDAEPVSRTPHPDRRVALERLLALIRRLRPLDRQVISLYLEGEDASAIAEVTGLSPGNVAVKIHRIKALLGRQFQQGERRANQAVS